MKVTYVLAGALIVFSTGCKHTKEEQSKFFPDQKKSTVREYVSVQAANGAREDGTLYARHFDNGSLNRLGKQKLSLMLGHDSSARPLTIYLVNVGQGDVLEKRKQAIRDFLKDGLRPDEKVEFVLGANPTTVHPAADSMSRLSKTESGTAAEGGAQTDQPLMSGAGLNIGAK